jgi:hypothetical protein
MLYRDPHYGVTPYPDPFVADVASQYIPLDWRSALRWCETVYPGTFGAAMERVHSYFLTKIVLTGVSKTEEEKWNVYLNDNLGIMSFLREVLTDRACYGNAFISVLAPFDRWLICKNCSYSAPLKQVYQDETYAFKWHIPDFIATCPRCQARQSWLVDDRQKKVESEVVLKKWSPHEIDILYENYTGKCEYLWRIPEEYKQRLRVNPSLSELENVNLEVLVAIKNNWRFRFEPDAIFHMKEPTLSGNLMKGWGIPRLFAHYKRLFGIQVLHRHNEALSLDFSMPWRVISPAPARTQSGDLGESADLLLNADSTDVKRHLQSIIEQRRIDPAGIGISPVPLNYQIFGAEATQLAPVELIRFNTEQLLNDIGVPPELFSASLQVQAAPVALRLFESLWQHLVFDCNKFLQWVVRTLCRLLSWETVRINLERVTIADNLEQKMMEAQLMTGQLLSRTTVLRNLGHDYDKERKLMAQEALADALEQARTQEKMQQQSLAQQIAKGQVGPPGGGAPPGGGGMPPEAAAGDPSMAGAMPPGAGGQEGPVTRYLASLGPNTQVTPEQIMQVAQSIAEELNGYPESVKDSELRKLYQHNTVLHATVQAIRKKMKQQASPA